MRIHLSTGHRAPSVLAALTALMLIAAACTSTPATSATADLKDFTIDIGGGTITAGKPTKFEVSNTGKTIHSLAIEVAGATLETKHLGPGTEGTLEVPALAAGTHKLWCSVPGHREAGMETTLTVAAGANGAAGGTDATGVSPDEIDRAHEAGVKAFPAKTQGLGGQRLKPRIVGDVKVFDLTAKAVRWEVSPDEFVDAFAYNGQIPGPEIRVRKGDKIEVVVHNELAESTTVHFHGVTVPNAMDGVPYITQPPIRSGESFTYAFTVTDDPGTHMYHSHHNATIQVGKGLLGAFIVESAKKAWDIEQTIVISDGPLGYTINGKGFPATAPIVAAQGKRVLIRYMNEGQQIHPMHLHGFPSTVIARDGRPTTPYTVDTLSVAPGERYDIVVTPTLKGVWAFHCHILSHAESEHGMHGMVTALIVE